jgi:hypothetical protein
MKKIFTSIFFFALAHSVFAFGDTCCIPIGRKTRHEDIKKEQLLCDKMDGKLDGVFKAGNNDDVNNFLTELLNRKPNEWRQWIEKNDTQIPTNNDKVKYLKYVADALSYFRAAVKEKSIAADELQNYFTTFEAALKARVEGTTLVPILETQTYGIAKTLKQLIANTEEKKILEPIIYLKFATSNPDKIFTTIEPFANEPFADSLIIIASKSNLIKLYNFAGSKSSVVGKLIHRSEDKLIKQIAQISQLENPLMYFPFLDNILSGKQSTDSIKKMLPTGTEVYDSIGYYKLLVQTAIQYSNRLSIGDTALGYLGTNGLLSTLRNKSIEHFVKRINDLHDASSDVVRMKAIQPLGVIELYYMMVMTDDVIYTSSYVKSFNRMLILMGKKARGDSLMLSVNYDHFRKFIKMAANYNKLDTFLKTMPADAAESVMYKFVKGLETAPLEDAVDVADSYSSITDKKLQTSILTNINSNEINVKEVDNKRGVIIYNLLNTVFKSLTDSTIDLTKEFKIPPIFTVANKYMQNENGKIIGQVFFYGDKDGKAFYPRFRASFSPKEWKVVDKPEWMEATAIKGNVIIYANKALDNDANLDDTAQIHLIKYFEEQKIKPMMVVHRGHSYWLPRTMERMPGDAKIVLLGSCGGYQNLNKILELNPDAHIISTKEIGAGDINGPIFSYMLQTFNKNEDLGWIKMWKSLTQTFPKEVRKGWESYIPPYKNLGAIFLKAYNIKAYE